MSAITSQPTSGMNVVPDNDNNIGALSRRMPVDVGAILWIGVGGNLVATTEGGDDVVFTNLPSGYLLPVKIKKVWVNNPALSGNPQTTCEQIRALY